MEASSADRDSTTPLGVPVDPEVATTSAVPAPYRLAAREPPHPDLAVRPWGEDRGGAQGLEDPRDLRVRGARRQRQQRVAGGGDLVPRRDEVTGAGDPHGDQVGHGGPSGGVG